MSEAPERIWTCSHLGEYGRYYPEAVEAEGEHGGTAVEYIRADHVADMLKAEREKALREAASLSWLCFHRCDVEVDVVTAEDILALISEDKTDGVERKRK